VCLCACVRARACVCMYMYNMYMCMCIHVCVYLCVPTNMTVGHLSLYRYFVIAYRPTNLTAYADTSLDFT